MREEFIDGTEENGYCDRREWSVTNAWYDDSPFQISVFSVESRFEFERDIRNFILEYEARKNSLRSVNCWHGKGMQVYIKCLCGHFVFKDAREFAKQHGDVADVFALALALRCSACNTKGDATIVPTYRKGFSPLERKAKHHDPAPEYGPDDIYEALGGNGKEDVYLTDGISLSPPDRS